MNDLEQLIQLGGWKLGPKDIEILLSTLLTVPTACMELITCGCKTKCSTVKCECLNFGQICVIVSVCLNPYKSI